MIDIYRKNGVVVKIVRTLDKEKIEVIGEIINSPKFDDLVYSDKQKEFMRLVLEKLKTERLNLLFSGSAGTGKTYSAQMIASETQKPYVYLNGQMSPKKIREILLSLKENSLVCIDEIHNLPEKIAEIIYPAIEYNIIGIDGKEIKLKNPTFIGTTTEPENLPKPLMDRFFRVEFEEPDENLLYKMLEKQGINQEIANYLINFTINIRRIKSLIRTIKMYGDVNMENLLKVFRMMRINLYSGMSDEQEKYLEILKRHRCSLKILSLHLRKSEDYIRSDIEPDLIRKDLIIITSRGRELNPQNVERITEVKNVRFTKDEREIAEEWLKTKGAIKDKLGKRYLELVNSVAECIHNGMDPEEVDWGSFSDDIPIKESIQNNYLEEL